MAYEFTDEAKQRPRWTVLDGKRVAMGQPLTLPATPPDVPVEVPLADQTQMKRLFDIGYTRLIRKVEAEARQTEKARPVKKDASTEE